MSPSRRRILFVPALLLGFGVCTTAYEAFVQARRRSVVAGYFELERWHELRFEQATRCQPRPRAVLIGDSMTAGFREHWPGPASVVNMGISGDFSAGVFTRLATVVACGPDRVFVMVGINDIVERVPPEETQATLLRIVRTLHRYLPAAKVHVQSVLPTFNRHGLLRSSADINRDAQALNEFLAARAGAEDYVFVDLVSLFVDAEKQLRPELTYDGIHLNRDGYAIWYRRLEPYLEAGPAVNGREGAPSAATVAPRPGGS